MNSARTIMLIMFVTWLVLSHKAELVWDAIMGKKAAKT